MQEGEETRFDEIFLKATGHHGFAYQRRLGCAEELPALLHVPTGAGKTAAATLAWLYRRRFHSDPRVRNATPRRLVYCLPMRVLVEQTVAAVRSWVRALDLERLVGVYQLMGGAVEDDWVRSPERDAVLVGTMDMLLSRALNRGYAAGRARWPMEFGLLNNDCLWVLDEVQLMGNGLAASAQLDAFRSIFGTARPCPSLWMSATVASEWLKTVDHPAPDLGAVLQLSDEDRQGALAARLQAPKTLRRLAASWPDEAARAIRDLHRPGTLTLVVTNTVDRARQIYRQLSRDRGEADVRLLHSQFRPPDRRAVVDALAGPPPAAGRILVATQVVEAGVDISAATLVTELAPWGSLVQRFGRCNRYGKHSDATVWWVDLGEKSGAPYAWEELQGARRRLEELEGKSVNPLALEALDVGPGPEARHVLRRSDLLDLFDTEPDLAGNDVDVSRFIRDDADVDVHVFWRRFEGAPAVDLPRPAADELCPVPVWELREFLRPKKGARTVEAYRWDHLERAWRPVTGDEVRPGMRVLLAAEAGGYSPEVGWDRQQLGPVEPIATALVGSEAEDTVDDDPEEETSGAWVRLSEHLGHVRQRLADLLTTLALELEPWQRKALLQAAFWHDLGKAHPVFQGALLAGATAPGAGPWAKRPGGRPTYSRRHFRHELASALALLALPAELHGLEGRALDLASYLVAAHHGKVRLAIRSLPGEGRPPDPERRFARGVWDDDVVDSVPLDGTSVPSVTLDLSVMEVGRGPDGRRSWAERALRLRDELGPFRLGFLEALLRVADWKASAEEVEEGA